MELETINKLYLELSQVATAMTEKEIKSRQRLVVIHHKMMELCREIQNLPPSVQREYVTKLAVSLREQLEHPVEKTTEEIWKEICSDAVNTPTHT